MPDAARAAGVRGVEEDHDRGGRDHVRRRLDPVGERRVAEQDRGRHAAGDRERRAAVPRPERQHREHRAELAEVHVPAGDRVALRREPRHECRNRRGGGRREDRGDARAQVRGERTAGRRALREVTRTEAVDHEQADVARAAISSGRSAPSGV